MWLTSFIKYQHSTRKINGHTEWFWEWHGKVIKQIEEKLQADRSDAQSVVEAQFDQLTSGWDLGWSEERVADEVIKKSKAC